ncbi:2459_t:CDS:2 [Gigaspora margarita]|uniref:2459_t:CDS:1 n=1 Tax=Gigaspora margarita TaxID=4874 RepID=A0ABN7W4X7_GIGMA|nr:2459_t:CDS:2 [Gigaspora margarita]
MSLVVGNKRKHQTDDRKSKKVCSVGSCTGTGDKKTYNACKMTRQPGVKVDRILLGPIFRNDAFYFNDTLYKLVWFWKLLQQERPHFNKLVLSDIVIHLTFTSLHPGQLGNLLGLMPWTRITTPFKPDGEDEHLPNSDEIIQMVADQFQVPVAGRKTFMSPLLMKMGLHFYLIHICDKDLAKKQQELIPEEILKNVKRLDAPESKDHFDIISYHYGELSYDNTATLSNIANFAFIMVVDYMPGFYKIRRMHAGLPEQDDRRITNTNSYFLGSEFSFVGGQTGLPVFFSDRSIELAYQYNANIENTLELAQIIVHKLRPPQNDNAMDQEN